MQVREVVNWDRQGILVCCVIPFEVDVFIPIFVLSSIVGHLGDRTRNIFSSVAYTWAYTNLVAATRGQRVFGQLRAR